MMELRKAEDRLRDKDMCEEYQGPKHRKKRANEARSTAFPWMCKLCYKDFERESQAKKHAKTCRKETAAHVHITKSNESRCSICHAKFRDRQKV